MIVVLPGTVVLDVGGFEDEVEVEVEVEESVFLMVTGPKALVVEDGMTSFDLLFSPVCELSASLVFFLSEEADVVVVCVVDLATDDVSLESVFSSSDSAVSVVFDLEEVVFPCVVLDVDVFCSVLSENFVNA